jgi:FtsH-binding integral membrane protein
MAQFEMTPQSAFEATAVGASERITAFLQKVYGWMFVGLAISAGTAFAVATTEAGRALIRNPIVFFGSILVELGLVFYLSARVAKMKPDTAAILFIVYSALNGFTLSLVLMAYTPASLATTFLVAAGMFGGMALWGTTTKRSLAGAGQFFFMGLIGIILASLAQLFFRSPALNFVISVVGVIVFTGLAAYDAQRMKAMALAVPEGKAGGSFAVVGALSLYLDFVNLFLFLLRFLGGRRD